MAEEEAARLSRVFFQTAPGTSTAGATAGVAAPNLAGLGLSGQPGTPTAQDRQLAFLNTGVDRRTVAPDRVMAPASPYVLQAGAVISATLITGIRSDLPGQITAQVTDRPQPVVRGTPPQRRLPGEPRPRLRTAAVSIQAGKLTCLVDDDAAWKPQDMDLMRLRKTYATSCWF